MGKNDRCTAEKPPEPEPHSSDLDNSPESEVIGRRGGRRTEIFGSSWASRTPYDMLETSVKSS